MYKGFDFQVKDNDMNFLLEYKEYGMELCREHREITSNSIKDFEVKSKHNTLNGGKLSAEWFPIISADIFISHSRKDAEYVNCLAGYLKKEFGLTCFIDGFVWGYYKDLVKILCDMYCYKDFFSVPNEETRNRSENHVTMMLYIALSKMIHNTECFFFINTPNSTMPSKDTNSAFIHYEMEMSRMLRFKTLEEQRQDAMSMECFAESLDIQHPLKMDHLSRLSLCNLQNLLETGVFNGATQKYIGLNCLYKQFGK